MRSRMSHAAHAERTMKGDAGLLAKCEPSLLEIVDDEPSDDEIHIVVAQIRRLVRDASLEFALRVGAIIIHHFYEGESDAWRSRGPKTASFRKLAQHPQLPLSAGALYRWAAASVAGATPDEGEHGALDCQDAPRRGAAPQGRTNSGRTPPAPADRP
jgi:hypothetical protein